MAEGLPQTGELLEGKYRIESVIGEGAWGEVLEATNIRIKRRVAIKVLKAQYASNPAMVGRFEREALASTHIESPHVVQIFDAGVLADGRPYMVMEFLVGEDLGKRIDNAPDNRLPLIEAVGFCIQAARGLGAAHTASIFHRDMKPSNIVIAKTKTGRELAKIVDFGISKLLNDQDATSNTQTGTIMGSPVYMSPEQARGSKNSDHRSDIYSLGVVLYECVTGRTPFVADSFNELLFKIALEDAPTPKTLRPDIDDELNEIIVKATARAPESRYQTAGEFEAAMLSFLQKSGDHADWATDTGGRGVDLSASPTRAKSLPDIAVASPVVGDKTPSQAPPKSASAPPPATKPSQQTVGKETSTSLSKTQDPFEPPPTSAANNKRVMYVGAAAAAIVIAVLGASSLKSGDPVKPDSTKTATSQATTAVTQEPTATAKPSAAPEPTATASETAAADAGAMPDSTKPATRPIVAPQTRPATGPIAAPAPAPAPKPATGPQPATTTSVGGRTVHTEVPF
jgi:serine/threonine-protein kinase